MSRAQLFVLLAILLIVLGIIGQLIWEQSIKPRLLPKDEINKIVDDLISKHGSEAEHIAFIEEDRAWRRSETFEQGKWHRVRKELWRRNENGEWS